MDSIATRWHRRHRFGTVGFGYRCRAVGRAGCENRPVDPMTDRDPIFGEQRAQMERRRTGALEIERLDGHGRGGRHGRGLWTGGGCRRPRDPRRGPGISRHDQRRVDAGRHLTAVLRVKMAAAGWSGQALIAGRLVRLKPKPDDADHHTGRRFLQFGDGFARVGLAIIGIVVDQHDPPWRRLFSEQLRGFAQRGGQRSLAARIQFIERAHDALGKGAGIGGIGSHDELHIRAIRRAAMAKRHQPQLHRLRREPAERRTHGVPRRVELGPLVILEFAPHGAGAVEDENGRGAALGA